MGQLKFLRDC